MNVGLVAKFSAAQAKVDPNILQNTNSSVMVNKYKGPDATVTGDRFNAVVNEVNQD